MYCSSIHGWSVFFVKRWEIVIKQNMTKRTNNGLLCTTCLVSVHECCPEVFQHPDYWPLSSASRVGILAQVQC